MRVIYLDPGLLDHNGHHGNYCLTLTGEMAARGVDTRVFGHVNVIPDLRETLRAHPFFRHFTYWNTDGDPISGWLNSFDQARAQTFEDLTRLPDIGTDDLLFCNSFQAPQLAAMLEWLRLRPAAEQPHVVIEFAMDPGLNVSVTDQGLKVETRDPRADARAVLYRFAATRLRGFDRRRLHFYTYEPICSQLFTSVLQTPVGVAPRVQGAPGEIRSRVGRRPPVVGLLGHQRPDKGFQLVPAVASALLAARPDMSVLVHNSRPGEMQAEQDTLRAIAAADPRLCLDERPADPDIWEGLLARTDLMVCPYLPGRYVCAFSAVAAEAISRAIPLVAPQHTTLATMVAQFGGGGLTFPGFAAEPVAATVLAALDRFDALAERAASGARQWAAQMGPKPLVDAILAVTRSRQPVVHDSQAQ